MPASVPNPSTQLRRATKSCSSPQQPIQFHQSGLVLHHTFRHSSPEPVCGHAHPARPAPPGKQIPHLAKPDRRRLWHHDNAPPDPVDIGPGTPLGAGHPEELEDANRLEHIRTYARGLHQRPDLAQYVEPLIDRPLRCSCGDAPCHGVALLKAYEKVVAEKHAPVVDGYAAPGASRADRGHRLPLLPDGLTPAQHLRVATLFQPPHQLPRRSSSTTPWGRTSWSIGISSSDNLSPSRRPQPTKQVPRIPSRPPAACTRHHG